MIEICNITRRYDDFFLQTDFHVESNEIVSLLGSSGSGKTTSLRIIAGFEEMDSGSILLNGQDVSHLPPQKRCLGLVFQDYTLFPHLDVARNIAYGLRAQGMAKTEHGPRVSELLELVGLSGFGGRSVQTLSGGEQQRVALARALAPRPQALLLDEPFSAVDTERRDELRRHIRRIQRELQIPMIFVTHSQSEALSISDRIVIMKDGAILEVGSPRELYLNPVSEYTARFLGKANYLPFPSGERQLYRPEQLHLSRDYSSDSAFRVRISQRHYHGAVYEFDLESDYGLLTASCMEEFFEGEQLWCTASQRIVSRST
ncbi:ABC transporter ATP-binding protein [Spirochaeta dissipatitropha]